MKCKTCGQTIIKTNLDMLVNRPKENLADTLGRLCGKKCPLAEFCPDNDCPVWIFVEWLERRIK